MNRRDMMKAVTGVAVSTGFQAFAAGQVPAIGDRAFWLQSMSRVAGPVLESLSKGWLRHDMPVESPHGNEKERAQFTYLEAFGRTLTGVAPWLELRSASGPEEALRSKYAGLARASLKAATDPSSPDFMNFSQGSQPVVDAAFLALGILRAPEELWKKLDRETQGHVIQALQASRSIKPGYNNWLLFSATIEACLCRAGVWWDPMRVDYALRGLESFYKGDGVYGDGPLFHWDYYNSFVIHPMMLALLDTFSATTPSWADMRKTCVERATRYAAVQERLIDGEGGFPAIGRSLPYRFGAFHCLADMSLRRQLPDAVKPAQVRCALTAVMKRMIEAPGTFDEHGWLRVGFYGHQPAIAESYISTGSLYLCSAAFLPLGLPEADPFWSGPAEDWTSKKIWRGEDVPNDHAIGV